MITNSTYFYPPQAKIPSSSMSVSVSLSENQFLPTDHDRHWIIEPKLDTRKIRYFSTSDRSVMPLDLLKPRALYNWSIAAGVQRSLLQRDLQLPHE
jgi:hypothetical protein